MGKVTIIYDRFKGVNVQTVILKDEVRYFAQNEPSKGCRYRGFCDLDSLHEYISGTLLECDGVEEFERIHKMRFNTEAEMCKWISNLCEKDSDLTEIFIK